MIARVLERLEASWDRWLEALVELGRAGGVSANAPPDPAVQRSARLTAQFAAAAGLRNVAVLEPPGSHPHVYADWLDAPGAPTVLLYAHHDVQPPGRLELWTSPPFEPTLRPDGRLYGRGIVDDKAGIVAHLAACASWLEAAGRLPVNVKLLVEGEEEIGSPNLERLLQAERDRLAADVIVLTDTANLDEGVPSITTSLRGLCAVEVEVRALDRPLHSGMWGGPIPDPVLALCRALSDLVDEEGRLRPELAEGVRPWTAAERERYEALPFDELHFRRQAGLVPGARLTGDPSRPVLARIWREPAVSVIAMEARPIEGSSNQIIESARARISVRVVPDQDPRRVQDRLVEHFERRVPWGLSVRVRREAVASWWESEPHGPAFDAVRRAAQIGYGRPAIFIGCGGTIPFVQPFARVFGGVPAVLLGIEDPMCNAHAENESLSIAEFRRATRTAVALYAELASAFGASPARC
ncbi:MAG: M20/M25/M40 family metallo-hydrolase [Myxococcota bacterium]|nr:M20/M25/M40 family metallo-hydrolase [Myxococcota bacterium]MDW8360916.1 M20/M25/M40 family metallo-hydrolase [Myxococcales bacterium]